MIEFKNREEFINGVVSLLSLRSDSEVLVIVKSQKGLETMQTTNDFTWAFGLLKATEIMFDHNYRGAMASEVAQKAAVIADAQMDAAINNTGGKAN